MGKHDDEKLQSVFKKFIKSFVLCPKCKGLQTKLDLDKKNKVIMKCKACGHKGEVDQSHKVIKEIQKVPPGSGKKEKGDKGEKKKGKKDRRAALKEGAPGEVEDAENDEAAAGAEKATPRAATEEEKAAKAAKKAEKAARKAEKAAKAAGASVPGSAKRGSADDSAGMQQDELEPQPEPAKSDAEYMAELEAKIKADGLAITASYWNGIAATLPVEKAVTIPFQVCFDKNMLKQVKKFQRLFIKICGEGHEAAQKVILQCTANLAAEEASVMAKLGHYIKALYDADLAEEETINSWFAELDTGSAAKKNVASFVKWLATVESDSEDESSDDSED